MTARRDRRREAWFALALAPSLGALFVVALGGPLERWLWGFEAAVGVASLAWLVAVRLATRGAGTLPVVVAGAIALRLVALAADPKLSDDVHRTVWEGALVCQGTSPYAFAPDAPELAGLRAAEPAVFAELNNAEVSAAYPPLAHAAGAGAVRLARELGREDLGAVLVVRALLAIADLLVLWPLVVLLRRAGLPESLAVLWGWSPLVVLEFAGSGHFDSLGILLLLGALAALPAAGGAGRRAGALVLLAGAILVKVLPLCALPFVARGAGVARDAAVARGRRGAGAALAGALFVLLLCALAFLPLLWMEGGTRGLAAGLGEYALRWESTSLLYRFIERPLAFVFERRDGGPTDPRVLGRAVAALLFAGWGVLVWRRRDPPAAATGAMIGAFLLLTPTLHPWYLAWIAPFAALRKASPARAAWLWLLATGPLLYVVVARWRAQGAWEEPAWLWPVVALPCLALLLASRLSRRAT